MEDGETLFCARIEERRDRRKEKIEAEKRNDSQGRESEEEEEVQERCGNEKSRMAIEKNFLHYLCKRKEEVKEGDKERGERKDTKIGRDGVQ